MPGCPPGGPRSDPEIDEMLSELRARPTPDSLEAMGRSARFRQRIGQDLDGPEPASVPRHVLRDAITAACFDPHLAGHRGNRTTDEWRADAVMKALEDLGVIPGGEVRHG